MTTDDTIRFLEHEARACREKDECEALCLLLPALLHAFNLPPMDDSEAAAFKFRLKQELNHEADKRTRVAAVGGPAAEDPPGLVLSAKT